MERKKLLKMKNIITFLIALISVQGFAQEKNFIDKPYIEVQGNADTLVTPNRIYIDVLLSEKDLKGKKNLEDLEIEMIEKLKSIGVNVDKNVTVQDMMSNYKKFLLKQTDIHKSKFYSVLVYDAKTTSKVLLGLEEIGISNVKIIKLEHSDEDKIQLLMNSKASQNAKNNALSLVKPFGQNIGKSIYIGKSLNIRSNLSGNVQGIMIRGNSSGNYQKSSDYDVAIEFEKISISSDIMVRFILE